MAEKIIAKRVSVHNLKDVSLSLDPHKLIVFSGVSGSGKSSLAFDTLYADGQRRYVESLPAQARRSMTQLPKPEAESIEGLSPTISIEQKTIGKNPRSTVGTITGIYDYLRVLFARIGIAHCPESGERVTPQSEESIREQILSLQPGTKLIFLTPYVEGKKGELKDELLEVQRKGFLRVRLDSTLYEIDQIPEIDPNVSHILELVVDRISLNKANHPRIAEAISTSLELGKGLLTVLNADTEKETLFSQNAYSKKSGLSYPPLEPHDFSFNHPLGMCPDCEGIGRMQEFEVDKIIDPEKSIPEGCCAVGGQFNTVKYSNIYTGLAEAYDFDIHTKWKDLPGRAQKILLHGVRKKYLKMRFTHPKTGKTWMEYIRWKGILHDAKVRYLEATSDSYKAKMEELMHDAECGTCNGSRIRAYPGATTVGGKTIREVTGYSIEQAYTYFTTLTLNDQESVIGKELIKEISQRLLFLLNVGLNYLTLDRTSPTLSGGESQRVRLASQIGSGLVGATYILDEPSIGLHPRDNTKLIQTLLDLKGKGNTVIVVEHDEETLLAADYIVDVGPGAGIEGGEIVAQGTIDDIKKNPRSITGQYLSGKKKIEIPSVRRPFNKKKTVTIHNATHHNLRNMSAEIPLGLLTVITGVSGSGKSSLISDILFPALSNKLHKAKLRVGAHSSISGIDHLDKVIGIDQSPIGRTPRSNPSTYIKLFDDIRDLFAELPDSIAQGFKPGRFSFNVAAGSCSNCRGMGSIKIDMDFLEDAYVECPVCLGRRFDTKTLSVRYKGRTISDILNMSVAEAKKFFHAIPSLHHKLDILEKVGLNYITLGQSSTTLSGGEAQRIKLAKELIRPSTGQTLYILDEPTTGLHFHDIAKLISILQDLVDQGNSVLIIEHNIDLIRCADWIIDIGPDGGIGGGEIIGVGTPEEIAQQETPTGKALSTTPEEITHTLQETAEPITQITLQNGTQNTLKGVSTTIPRGKITVCTGVSGSGKTSLAFDTVYAEGQRRYTESLSPYARQFIKQMPKPHVGEITGLSPAIAIEQKHHAGNPRSTIGTMTEIYDYLRLLYAHMGVPHCPETGEEIQSITKEYVVEHLMKEEEGTKLYILAPVHGDIEEVKEKLRREGFVRIRLNGEYLSLDEEFTYNKKRKNEVLVVIDRLFVKPSIEKRLYEALEQVTLFTNDPFIVQINETDTLFNLNFAVVSTGKTYPTITPNTFSFNADEGMCLSCLGLGFAYGADILSNQEFMRQSPLTLLDKLWKDSSKRASFKLFEALLEQERIDPDLPLAKQPPKDLSKILGGGATVIWNGMQVTFEGLNKTFANIGRSGKGSIREAVSPQLTKTTCLSCKGQRLNPLALHVTIEGKSIADLCSLPLSETEEFFKNLTVSKMLQETYQHISHRIAFLIKIGLDYLSLQRTAPTLSGGESQRIHLARQLGSKLTGCLYVLDEPTIGLHPHNNARLNETLKELAALDNTLLLVEHDPLTISIADKIIDFGPKAGEHGGEIVAEGTIKEIEENSESLTGQYLSYKKTIPVPTERTPPKNWISIRNVTLNNINDLSCTIPTGVLCGISGVSGSGKSTLIHQALLPAIKRGLLRKPIPNEVSHNGATISGIQVFDKVIALNQSPIGTTSRADVNTYSDLHTPLRQIFAELNEAKVRGLKSMHFSYNHLKGMCRSCWGLGYKKVRLQFMPAVRVPCEACQGAKLNPVSSSVTYQGKNIGSILKLSVDQALEFLPKHPKILAVLETLQKVGLGYLKLGQEIASLSGGEAQRLRLTKELSKRGTGKTLYLFDEPTIGLHPDDTIKLLSIFKELVQKGNTVLLIEHNLDMLKNCDYILDLGPDAGIYGGKIVASGTPEEIIDEPASKTGAYLAPLLAHKAAL